MTASIKTYRLDGTSTSIVFASDGDMIDLIYFGPALPEKEDLTVLAAISQFGSHENQPENVTVGGLLPEVRNGFSGKPALKIRQGVTSVDTCFELLDVTCTEDRLVATWKDCVCQVQVSAIWQACDSDVFKCHYRLSNKGNEVIFLEAVPSLVLPLPAHFTELTSFPGRWAREMQATRHQLGPSMIEMRSSGGKPGFDPGNWLIFHSNIDSSILGCHLAWNGDHIALAARDRDGQATVHLEATLDRNAADLVPGGAMTTPVSLLSFGLNEDEFSHNFHQYVRKEILPLRSGWGPRKVHLNSWEALGFKLSQAALIELANEASALGVERFVLDDGWFKGRRNDKSGIGDWVVDPNLFPTGLGPLIDHVRMKGMDFGLWIEPEMVSPDSDLYRTHPDWCIHDGSERRPTERNQLVLDLSRRDVMEYLFAAITDLLANNNIAYLKWDHNRRQFPLGAGQTEGYIELLNAVTSAHPDVEIEHCSSGGGRIDLRSLAMAHRVWPSDNNDPIERLRINRSWARFLPLEIMGNHVGPSPNPITGRRTDIDFRAKVALFGHMGVEANPADMDAQEKAVLAQHIVLYKTWREILHYGKLYHLIHDDSEIYSQIVVSDGKAIAFAAQTGFAENFNVTPLRFKALDSDAFYRVKLPKPWPPKASAYLANPGMWENGVVLSGTALLEKGLSLPLTHPETAWIITFEKEAVT